MRSTPIRSFLPVLAVVALVCATAADPSPADAPSQGGAWKAVAASGGVESRPPAAAEPAWMQVRRGDLVPGFADVRTARRGRATFVGGASVIVVDPGSEIVLPAAMGDGASVRQSSGTAIYEVDGTRQRSFRVETPYLVAGVKGTVFLVSVRDGRAAVTVREGTVEVTSTATGERTAIRAGESIVVREDAESEMVRVPAAGSKPPEGPADPEARHVAWIQARRLDQAVDDRVFLLRAAIQDGEDPAIVRTASRLLTGPSNADATSADAGAVGVESTLTTETATALSRVLGSTVDDVCTIDDIADRTDDMDGTFVDPIGTVDDAGRLTGDLIDGLLGSDTSGSTGTGGTPN